MARFRDCNGCAQGDHQRHHRTIWKGRLDAVWCECSGDCKERHERRLARRITTDSAIRPKPICDHAGCTLRALYTDVPAFCAYHQGWHDALSDQLRGSDGT